MCVCVCVCEWFIFRKRKVNLDLLLLKLGILCSFLRFSGNVDIGIYTIFENLGLFVTFLIYFKLSKVIRDSTFDIKSILIAFH